ncbi:MAG: hypothetical protein ACK5ZC_10140 [Pirellulaceae bacterium]|jgi:hypothetical protein
MTDYAELADDFYINMQLQTALEIPQQRDAATHFFEQVQRRYPKMRTLVTREKETFLEEDKELRSYRWVSLDVRRISSGVVNPPEIDDAIAQHRQVLSVLPYSLAVSHLDCESLNLVFGFDYTYRGNHNQLLIQTLGLPDALQALADIPGAQCMGYEPSIQVSLDPELRTQCRISFETRSTPSHIRSREYPDEQLSVYFALRRIDSLQAGESFEAEFDRLGVLGRRILDDYIVENVLQPLQQAIALQ